MYNCGVPFSKSQKLEQTATPLYPGELRQMHGLEEAARFMRNGKYRKVVDADGDECYVKTTQKQVTTKERETAVEASRTIDEHI